MFKEFLMKKMLERQLKDVPPEQREMLFKAFEKDPDFFMRLAKEADEKTKSGMNKMYAAQSVFAKHADELRKLLGK